MGYENCSAGRFHREVIYAVMDSAKELGYIAEDEVRAYEDLETGFRPDVVLVLKNTKVKFRLRKVFVEVQWGVTSTWLEKIKNQYSGRDYFVIPLKDLAEFKDKDRRTDSEELYKQVKAYVDTCTCYNPGQKRRIKQKKPCKWCGRELLNVYEHEYRCKYNPKNKKGE